jgi:nucleoside permease NupC
MFQQYIADGANIFIAITAVIIGFVAALVYVDFLKTTGKEEKKDH